MSSKETDQRLARRLVPEYTHLFDERLLTAYERDAIERRLAAARRQLAGLLEARQRLRLPSRGGPGPRPPIGAPEENRLLALAREVIERQAARPGVKQEVVRSVLDEVGRLYLWTSLAGLPVFHEVTVLVPWWSLSRALRSRYSETAEALVEQLLHGVVLSLQRVREEVLTAEEVYLAHCACRSAGVAHDLEQDGEVFTLLDEGENRRLLDRIVDRFVEMDRDRLAATTNERFRAILDGLARARAAGAPEYRLERLLRETWHEWEILPVREGFTPNWARSLEANGKCAPVAGELAVEMVNIFFHARGAVFNSMKCVDSPYTICTCPTPENEGGCVLTNWYYFARSNSSLIPADDHYGRLRDPSGEVLPCRYFPIRARRPCIGCGCNHSLAGPRDLDASFEDTDALLARHRAASTRGGDRRTQSG